LLSNMPRVRRRLVANTALNMSCNLLAIDLISYIDRLVDRHPMTSEIWIIGSRANNTASPESDWDFIAFGGQLLFDRLRKLLLSALLLFLAACAGKYERGVPPY
jgi:hypothetical protein